MKKIYSLSLGAICVLAACSMGDTSAMKPGKWRTTTEVESIEAPGMPPSALEQMKTASKGAAVEVCMTKEMVAQPGADMFAPKGGSCTTNQFELKDGKVSAKMSCSAGGSTQDIVMEGKIEPEIYTLRTTVNSQMPGAGQMKMVTKVESRRVGDC